MNRLLEILSLARPHGGASIDKLVDVEDVEDAYDIYFQHYRE